MIRFIFFLSINFGVWGYSTSRSRNCISNVTELIIKDGFPAEERKIVTQDGYILTAHRILPRTDNPSGPKNESVLFLHGLFFGSPDWLLLGPDHSLPYMMSKEGYDVWLLNSRGNDYSQEHLYLNPNTSSEYWDFSWHEMGVYDVNSSIDYITSNSNSSNVTVVCHSQGCTEMFVAANYYPDLSKRVNSMCAFSPAAYLTETRNKFVRMMATTDMMYKPNRYFKFAPRYFKNKATAFFSNFMPDMGETFFTMGYDLSGTNMSVVPMISCYSPSSVSMKQLYHYYSTIRSGRFAQFDYGLAKNYMRYYSPIPPSYDLSKVEFPVCAFYALNDELVVPNDARRAVRELPNVVAEHFIDVPNFSHTDFLYGKNVGDLVYSKVLQEMERAKFRQPKASASAPAFNWNWWT